jgi:hypothetical protein
MRPGRARSTGQGADRLASVVAVALFAAIATASVAKRAFGRKDAG